MKNKRKNKIELLRILFLELALLFLLFSFSFSFFTSSADAEIAGNATVDSGLSIGNSNPNIISVDIEAGSITLTPNTTTLVNCSTIVEDYDGDTDLENATARFFDNSNSSYGAADDYNDHYVNNSCNISTAYGDSYQALVTCLFLVEYYANPGTWNCSVNITDFSGFSEFESNTTEIDELLAFGLPDSVDYGTINATYVSNEMVANITNYGNIPANLSLNGYGQVDGDGYAMVCDYGATQNISVEYEKYNLTDSIVGDLTLTHFEGNYTNLSDTMIVEKFNIYPNENDTENNQVNSTYWRIYVPTGVGGTCNGTILFGAVKAVAT